MTQTIHNWKAGFLSDGGCLCLVKLSLGEIKTYYCLKVKIFDNEQPFQKFNLPESKNLEADSLG